MLSQIYNQTKFFALLVLETYTVDISVLGNSRQLIDVCSSLRHLEVGIRILKYFITLQYKKMGYPKAGLLNDLEMSRVYKPTSLNLKYPTVILKNLK